jgi:hypothetical protein
MSVGVTLLLLLPATTSAATLRTPPNNLGLVGYWSFEDGQGSTVTDFSGSGNDGTLQNMDPASDWVSGKRGTALDFDGSDDYADVGKVGLSGGSTRTISGWVKSSDESQQFWVGLFGFNDGGQSDNSFDVEISGNSGKYVAHVFGNQWDIAPQSASWHHIAMTYDGSQLKAWFDGTLKVDVSYGALSAKDSFGFAHRNDNNNRWAGKIDEVRVYNRALSASEVRDLYRSGYSQVNSSRELEDIDGLVGWWTMDGKHIDWDAGSDEVKDASDNGNDGALNGGMSNDLSATKGRLGQALDFDGNNDEVDLGTPNVLGGEPQATWMAWVKPDSISSAGFGHSSPQPAIGAASGGCDDAYGLMVGNSNQIGAHIDPGPTNYQDGGGSVSAGNWYHLAARWSDSSDQVDLFLDANKVKSFSASGTAIESNCPVKIGASDKGDRFDGLIDEVRTYKSSLSKSEIERIYNANRPSGVNTSQTDKLTDGLVGFWSFDGSDVDLSDGSAEVKDASGNANHGDAKNGAKPAIGKLGQGYKFDGSDDYIVTNNNTSITGTDPRSISAWYRTSKGSTWFQSNQHWASLVDFPERESTEGSFMLTVSSRECSGDDIAIHMWGANTCSGKTLEDVGLNEWHHLVGTMNGNGNQKIYIDGVKEGESSYNPDTPSGPIHIGRRLYSNSFYFNGTIDNVRIYDRALSASEVDKLYQLGN